MNATSFPRAGLQEFIRISELVLDEFPLPPAAAQTYLDIVLRATPARYAPGDYYEGPGHVPADDPHPFDALWAVCSQLALDGDAGLAERFMAVVSADVTLVTLVRNILIVWYNGYLGTDMPGAQAYAAARVWPAIGANPPGLPGPYYGHWAYPPERPIASTEHASQAGRSHHEDARPRR